MDILTLFFRDNFYQLNMLVEREAAKCSGGNTSISKEDVDKLNKPQFDFSSLQRIRDEMFKAKPAVFNPLKSHKVFNVINNHLHHHYDIFTDFSTNWAILNFSLP